MSRKDAAREIALAGILFIVFYLVFRLAKTDPALGEDPWDAVGSFGLELAAAGLGLSLFRLARPYSARAFPPAARILIARGNLVAVLAVSSSALAYIARLVIAGRPGRGELPILLLSLTVGGALVAQTMPLTARGSFWSRLGLGVGVLIMGLVFLFFVSALPDGTTLVTLVKIAAGLAYVFVSVWGLTRPLDTRIEAPDLVDDVVALAHGARLRLPELAATLRRFWWLAVIVVGIGAAALLSVAELVSEGPFPTAFAPRFLLRTVIVLGFEVTAVAFGWLLLGQFLSLPGMSGCVPDAYRHD